MARLKGLKAVTRPLEEAWKAAEDLAAMVDMADEDEEMAAAVPDEVRRLEKLVADLEVNRS